MKVPTKKVLIGAGLAIACASVVVEKSLAQRYSSLPVNLHKTSESKGGLTIRLSKQPRNSFVLGLTVEDADIPDEGYLVVNGRKVASLFGGTAQSGNDQKVTKIKIITPPGIWRAGDNRVEFVRTRTNGFDILALNTWEIDDSSTEPSPSDTSAQASSGTRLERSPQAPVDPPEQASPLSPDSSSEQVALNPESEDSEHSGVDDVLPYEIPAAYGGSGTSEESVPSPEPENSPIETDRRGSVIYWQEVVDQSTKPHDVTPIPAITSRYCGSHYGAPVAKSVTRKPGQPNCNRHQLDDANALKGYTEFNIWNHVARVYSGKYSRPNGQRVEMGKTRLAVLTRGGKWITREFKATCLGRLYSPVANGIDGGENGGNPVAQPCSDTAILGYGLGRWTNSKHQYHGWPGQRMSVQGEDVVAVAGWFPAKLINSNLSDNNQYLLNIGMDKKGGKAAGKTARFSGAFSSRYVKLPKNGRSAAIFGSTLSGDRWKELCQQGNLPAGFPFEKGCNVPRG